MEEIRHKEQLKRARRVALVLATVTTICMMSFVYAYVQTIEAKRNLDVAVQLKQELENQKAIAERNEQLAKESELVARQALEECQKNIK